MARNISSMSRGSCDIESVPVIALLKRFVKACDEEGCSIGTLSGVAEINRLRFRGNELKYASEKAWMLLLPERFARSIKSISASMIGIQSG